MPINKFRGVTRAERINNIKKAQDKYVKGKSAGLADYANRPSYKSFTSSLAPTSSFYQYKPKYLSVTDRINKVLKSQQIYSKGGKGKFPNLTQYAVNALYSPTADKANSSSFAPTSSYYQTSSMTIGSLDLLGDQATGSLGTNIFSEITASAPVDQFSETYGNAAMWLVSISSGSALKTSEVVATWGSSSINFYSTEVSQIGDVPVYMSATNVGGNISLIANPSYGTWTIKIIRMSV